MAICQKPDRHIKSLKCGHPLPCPWHTVIIDTAGPKVIIPPDAGLSDSQGKKVRELFIKVSDSMENL